MFYLDPHTTYNTFDIRRATNAELKTYHCSRIRVMNISNLDPSLAFGFLCSNTDELSRLTNSLKDINSTSKSFPIVSVSKKRRVSSSIHVSSVSSLEEEGSSSVVVSQDEKGKNRSSGDDWTLL